MDITVLLLLLLSSQLSICKSLLDDPCEDWVPYKDEKCLKIFDQNLMSYTDAENICNSKGGAHLLSINTEVEQLFIEDLLKSQNVVDNVWIGLKYANESYVWEDGTKADYTHWASGSPVNDSNYCVELETEETVFGFWTEVACTKKNLVICEKTQLWSLSKIQETLIKVVRNTVPIGFIYVQLPKEKPPQEVWSGMEWEDVSSDYAGLFFRTEGGNSATFGEIQDESSPRLAMVRNHPFVDPDWELSIPRDGERSKMIFVSTVFKSETDHYVGLSFQLSKEEVCPRNTAIRIWKRTS